MPLGGSVQTGAVEIAQIVAPVPSDLLVTGANANSMNAVVWTVWNDIYTGTISLTSNGTGMVNCSSATTTNLLTTNMTVSNMEVWAAWNQQVQSLIAQSANTQIGNPINTTTTSNIVTASNSLIWSAWNQGLGQPTGEQVREAQRRAQEQQALDTARYAQVRIEQTAANQRAEKLLQETLTPKERVELAEKGFFTLESISKRDGQRRLYRISRGRSRNVHQVDDNGRVIKTLCAHPMALVPDADTMLAQKLMLQADQDEFLRIANHS